MVRESSGCTSALLAILIAVVMALPVTGTAEVWSSAAQSPSESVLRIGLLDGIDTLNPFMAVNESSRFFLSLVYDGLLAVGKDLEPVSNLATSWAAVPAMDLASSGEPYGSVWEYKLTRNATWHDGTPFTADDVVFTVNVQVGTNFWDFWSNEPYTYYINYTERVDNYTVRMHFVDADRKPMPLAFGDSITMPILPKHLLQNLSPHNLSWTWSGTFSGPIPVVGTGPFMATSNFLDELSHGDHVTLIRNPYYHWAGDKLTKILLDKIELHFFDNATVMSSALLHNLIDVAKLPLKEYKDLKTGMSSGSVSDIGTYEGLSSRQDLTYIAINLHTGYGPGFRRDPEVRRALAMAVDKEAIVRNNYSGLAVVGSTLISPIMGDWHYEPTVAERFSYSLAEANDTLDAAGYRDLNGDGYREEVNGYPPYSLKIIAREGHPIDIEIEKYLASQWRKLGIAIEIATPPELEFTLNLYSGMYDVAIVSGNSDPNPNYLLFTQSRVSLSGWNDNFYNNASYDENYSKSVKELDNGLREDYVANCQRIHYLDAGYIILAYPYQLYAWRTDSPFDFGSWDSEPGRSLDAHWGGNAFLFGLLPASWGVGSTVDLPDLHVSIVVPDGWSYQRNITVGGAFYDVAMNTTALGGYRAVAYLQVLNWTGAVTEGSLYEQAAIVLHDLEQNYTLGFSIVSPPENLTINGVRVIEFTLRLNAGSTYVTERVVIVASERLGLAWIMYLAAPESMFGSVSADLDAIQAGISPEQTERNSFIWLLVVGIVIAAAAVAVVLGLLLLRKRRGKPSQEFPPLDPPSA
jgi:peptide/nickel transport system substrate-binding protein